MSEFTTIQFKSEGFDKAYIKELEERLKLSEFFAYGNLIGWAITIFLYEFLKS